MVRESNKMDKDKYYELANSIPTSEEVVSKVYQGWASQYDKVPITGQPLIIFGCGAIKKK